MDQGHIRNFCIIAHIEQSMRHLQAGFSLRRVLNESGHGLLFPAGGMM